MKNEVAAELRAIVTRYFSILSPELEPLQTLQFSHFEDLPALPFK